MLLTYNASVNKADSYDCTPLYEAALGGYIKVVKILLTNNATVNKADKDPKCLKTCFKPFQCLLG